MNRAELRVGGIAALVGGAVGFVANLMHPTPPADPEALLRLVAATSHWPQLHFMGMLSALFNIGAMALLSRNLANETARAIGVLGRYVFVLGGAGFVVMIMIDGFASKAAADRLFAANLDQQASLLPAAIAVVWIERALFPVFAGVFLGLAFVLMGAAVWKSENFPRWLGGWGIAGGGLCFLVGLGSAFRFAVPLPVWLVGVVAVVTWILATGRGDAAR